MSFFKSKKNRYFIQFVLFIIIGFIYMIFAISYLEMMQMLIGLGIFIAGSFTFWTKYKKEKEKEENKHDKKDMDPSNHTANQQSQVFLVRLNQQ